MYSNVVTAIDKILRSYYVSTNMMWNFTIFLGRIMDGPMPYLDTQTMIREPMITKTSQYFLITCSYKGGNPYHTSPTNWLSRTKTYYAHG